VPGSVKRLSVAVLVNELQTQDAEGNPTTTPRSEEELTALRDLVAMAAGVNEERGDTLTIHSLSFQPIENTGVTVERDAFSQFSERHLMTLIQIVVLSIVTIVLGLFVVKPLLKVEAAPEPQPAAEQLTAVEPAPETFPPDALEALKSLATDKTDETAGLIQSWLEEPETAS
jgi:flagellar M-ring protein FliF